MLKFKLFKMVTFLSSSSLSGSLGATLASRTLFTEIPIEFWIPLPGVPYIPPSKGEYVSKSLGSEFCCTCKS